MPFITFNIIDCIPECQLVIIQQLLTGLWGLDWQPSVLHMQKPSKIPLLPNSNRNAILYRAPSGSFYCCCCHTNILIITLPCACKVRGPFSTEDIFTVIFTIYMVFFLHVTASILAHQFLRHNSVILMTLSAAPSIVPVQTICSETCSSNACPLNIMQALVVLYHI